MTGEGINIFLGPPFSGKETQTSKLSERFGVPVFSMGHLIRQAKDTDPVFLAAFNKYSLNGLHVPIDIKFGLLKREMDNNPNGFILDNFPASQEDLDVFNEYAREKELKVNKVFYLNISQEEMFKRFERDTARNRPDDNRETIATRRAVQGADLVPVIEYYRSTGQLVEIDGEQPEDVVSEAISNYL